MSRYDNVLVRPEFRQRVRELAESQWREPVTVLLLDDDSPGYDVPGRRADGTVKGKRLVRRFFWNILRGVFFVGFNIFTIVSAFSVGNPFNKKARVTGPANAMALELLDAARPASAAWLVYAPSHLAVVATGPTYLDPADAAPPRFLWQARPDQFPEINLRKQSITWPDGSTYVFQLSRTES
jgi:hypothetical protein